MDTSNIYRKNHLLAKAVVYIVYVAVGIFSIEAGLPYLALTLGTMVWLFGVNSVAYCIETIAGHTHQHSKV